MKRAFGLWLTVLIASTAPASASTQAGILDFRFVCGIWGSYNPTPGLERAGVCVYDASIPYATTSGAGYNHSTWLWTWHERATGGTTFREGEVQGCSVWLFLLTREPDATKRHVFDPQYSTEPAGDLSVEGRNSMLSLASGSGNLCEGLIAQGSVTVGFIYTGQWPIAQGSVGHPMSAATPQIVEAIQSRTGLRIPVPSPG